MPVIEVQNLSKVYRVFRKREGLRASVRSLFRRKYEAVAAVDGVSFTIEAGEMVAFLGPNGAGKTTTLKLLSGLIFPSAGDARVLGHVPWKRENAYRRRFSLVMGQKNQLWWDLPAQESFRLHREIYAIDRAQFNQVQTELTEMLGVTDLLRQPVRELSLGERMKMELIAALLHSPKLLLLDEPTIGLDVVAQESTRQCLLDYNLSKGVTVLLTSHYMKDVAALCRRVLVINHGRIIYDGLLSGIVERFSHHKLVRIQLAPGTAPPVDGELGRFGEVVSVVHPLATIKVPRPAVSEVLSALLDRYTLADVSVEDPPLEEVIADVFSHSIPDQPTLPIPIPASGGR